MDIFSTHIVGWRRNLHWSSKWYSNRCCIISECELCNWRVFGRIMYPKFRRYIIYKASWLRSKVWQKFVKKWDYLGGYLHIIGLSSFEIKRRPNLIDIYADHSLMHCYWSAAWENPMFGDNTGPRIYATLFFSCFSLILWIGYHGYNSWPYLYGCVGI